MKKLNKYLIPLNYSLITRSKTLLNFIETIYLNNLYFIFIIIFIFIFEFQFNLEIKKILLCSLINLFVFLQFYEIGYIINDIISVKFEKNPTNRIKFKISKKFFYSFILLRLFLTFLFFIYLFIYFYKFILLLILLYLLEITIFLIHNFLKNISFRIITFFLLRFLKYFITILPLWIHLRIIFKLLLLFLIISFCIYYLNGYLKSKKLNYLNFNTKFIEINLLVISITIIILFFKYFSFIFLKSLILLNLFWFLFPLIIRFLKSKF